ncbi:MAG: lamin tail domain-containing protein [Clostridiales bacterium]|nr:lamin tail domain-containing protein [Clostridiales bacterium]
MSEENTILNDELEEDFPLPKARPWWRLTPSRAAGLVVAGLLLICLILWLVRFSTPERSQGLVINEVVTDNRGCYVHPTLGMTHWVELYNGSERDINLAGYGLSDDPKHSYRFRLPEGIIPAGGYLLVFFTGGTPQADDEPLATGFGLQNEAGVTLVLVDADYHLLDEVRVPWLDVNQAYARVNATDFAVTDTPTPLGENVFGNP